MASRESVPQFGLAAYPHPYPHPDDTGRYQAARGYHSRVVIRKQDDTQRHQTTRQSAHLKTARAAKPSGVRIPLPPPKSLINKAFLRLVGLAATASRRA